MLQSQSESFFIDFVLGIQTPATVKFSDNKLVSGQFYRGLVFPPIIERHWKLHLLDSANNRSKTGLLQNFLGAKT